MGTFAPYVRVLDVDELAFSSGRALGDMVAEWPDYQARLPLGPVMRDDLLRLAALPGNEHLRKAAQTEHYVISFEHLRALDPGTRVAIGFRIDYEYEEAKALELR